MAQDNGQAQISFCSRGLKVMAIVLATSYVVLAGTVCFLVYERLQVQHIPTELKGVNQTTPGGQDCPDSNANQQCCTEGVLRELSAAFQSLREGLWLENTTSDVISKVFENLRGEIEKHSYKFDSLEETCQKNSLQLSDSTYEIYNKNLTINELERNLIQEVEVIKNCTRATCGKTKKRSIRPPSFISQWFHMKAYDSIQSKVIIKHGLNELPAKVDVQVKSVSGANNGWIFPGTSVYQADDDTGEDYGGFVYFYNSTHVILSVPTDANDNGQGYVVTTGFRNDFFLGSHHYKYIETRVRVRIWLLDTFPSAFFKSQWYSLDITDADKSFNTIRHGLSSYPAFVNVQVRSSTLVSEASGSSLTYYTGCCDQGGGVVYGIDDRMIRIWTAYIKETKTTYGRLFGMADGWAYNPSQILTGEFRVLIWGKESFADNHFYTRESSVMGTQTGTFLMPNIDIDNDIVSFYAQALDGPNQGFLFNGWGSSQAVRAPFGGVIYAYNKQGQFRTWRPNPRKQGYLVNINSPYEAHQRLCFRYTDSTIPLLSKSKLSSL